MGLGAVELVMALEEEFGTEIFDAAAEQMRTPRDVIEWLGARTRRAVPAAATAEIGLLRHQPRPLAGSGRGAPQAVAG
jgi:hypothetical protein